MPTDVAEVQVERDQGTTLGQSLRGDPFVARSGQPFVPRRRDIVAGLAQDGPDQVGNVLIQLDGRHGYAGIGTIRSRANSAAYASAAGIASAGSVGYCS